MEISPYNLTWRRYKLDTTPYFQHPLSLDEENRNVPITTFIGRAEERRKLKNIIQLGGDRCIVHGQAGVGKTTLVNYIRYEAKEGDFFTTLNEIEINRVMSANEFIILTLSQIYDQLKHENFPVTGDLAEKLKMLYELNQQAEFQGGLTQVTQLNRNTLLSLFKQIVRELIPKYKGLVLHYDNFDNIEDTQGIGDMLGELRDFFLTPNVTFIFVGGTFFPSVVMQKKQVSQIIGQEILVEPLNLHDVNAILDSRIAALKIDVTAVKPHTPEAVKVLFELYDGNLRDILRSLNTCVIELPKTNTPIQITADVLKDTLYKKVDREFLTRLTPTDKEILAKILNKDRFTPSELAALSKRPIQNISSKYLKKFVTINAVKYIGAEGRNRYYVASHELKWWKFGEQRTSPKQPKREVDKRLMEFFS